MSAMKLKDKLPFFPVQVGLCDQLVGCVAKSLSHDVWVPTWTHCSMSEAVSVYYKMVNMRLPGEDTNGLLFLDPDINYPMLVIQYAFSWEDDSMQFLDLDKLEAVICPGVDTTCSRYLYLEIDLSMAGKVIEIFHRYPRFPLLPLKWYIGEEWDEQSGKQLSGSSAVTMTQESETLEAWGPCEIASLTNVSPYWKDTVLR